MISVRYVAPLKHTEMRADYTCHLDPYTMLSTRMNSMLYVVQVEHDDQQTGLMEGDQLIVDESLTPCSGDMGIYGIEGVLYVFRIYKDKGVLCPIGYKKLDSDQVIFGGVVTRLVRFLYE